MNIFIIPYNYPTSEYPQRAIFVADQVNALRDGGHNVDVVGTIPKTLSDVISSKNLKFGNLSSEKWLLSIPAIRGLERINQFLSLFFGKKLVKSYLKKSGNKLPDIVHVHNATSAKLAIWIKQTYGVPFIITEHSSLLWNINNKTYSALQNYYQASQANLAVSERFSEHLSQTFGVPFKYMPNVVDTRIFTLKNLNEKTYFNSDNSINLVSVGNLTINKNHQLIIKVMSELLTDGFDVSLKIAGEGPEKLNLQRLIDSLGLDSRITLMGRQDRNAIKSLLQESDYFLLPSLKETFGVVLIEAMAVGLPVISLKNGGSETIIQSNVGVLVDDESTFKESLVSLLTRSFDPKLIHKHVVSHYSPAAVVNKLINIYKNKGS